MRKIFFVSVMYCQTLVSPGIGAALQQGLPIKALITLLLPEFG
jgi:hypothetical protein